MTENDIWEVRNEHDGNRSRTQALATDPSARPRQGRASRVVIGTLATLAGLAGIEHGIGEILQGSARPEGLVIESWPDAAAMEILQGEPAMITVPDLLISGSSRSWLQSFSRSSRSGSRVIRDSVSPSSGFRR